MGIAIVRRPIKTTSSITAGNPVSILRTSCLVSLITLSHLLGQTLAFGETKAKQDDGDMIRSDIVFVSDIEIPTTNQANAQKTNLHKTASDNSSKSSDKILPVAQRSTLRLVSSQSRDLESIKSHSAPSDLMHRTINAHGLRGNLNDNSSLSAADTAIYEIDENTFATVQKEPSLNNSEAVTDTFVSALNTKSISPSAVNKNTVTLEPAKMSLTSPEAEGEAFFVALKKISSKPSAFSGKTISLAQLDSQQEDLPPSSETLTPNNQSEIIQPEYSLDSEASLNEYQKLAAASSSVNQHMINELSVDIRPAVRNNDPNQKTTVPADFVVGQDKADTLPGYEIRTFEKALYVGTGLQRFYNSNVALWSAPGFYHRPLYFEQPNLERYGHYVHGDCTQSLISAAHFFGTIPILPYKMGAKRPLECDYTLGQYRPGNCNPHKCIVPPLSYRGLVNEGLFVTGAFFLIP